jgi:hypothetical protein
LIGGIAQLERRRTIMIRFVVLFAGLGILSQVANATPIVLTPPSSSVFIGSGGGLGDNRGVYVTATGNFDVTHIGIALSYFHLQAQA